MVQYAVNVRNFSDGIHSLFVVETKEGAEKLRDLFNSLETAESECEFLVDEIWNVINSISYDCIEINFRDISNNKYNDIEIVNDCFIDISM